MPISREEIVAEIRKFVSANNGEIPGERTFVNATRIKPSTWKGRFWVRWTDAAREAGYDPNSMTQRIPEEDMLTQLAGFVVELGYFPVRDESICAQEQRRASRTGQQLRNGTVGCLKQLRRF
jgi:hypothetical protein